MNQEKNINELILEELLKLRMESEKHNSRLEILEQKVDKGFTETKEGFEDVAQSFEEMGEVIHFVGNKVFDNHERRIAALEDKE